MIILDFGSGNSCLNDEKIIYEMIRGIVSIHSHRTEVIFKWQLFEKAGDNIPLDRLSFIKAFEFAKQCGYQTTASVFDAGSLRFLLRFDVPFVKIANRPELYPLTSQIPDDIRVIKSVPSPEQFVDDCMCCISEYPAKMKDYEKIFLPEQLKAGISDHTTDWKLYEKYHPDIYEVHYCLEDSTGLDAGPFARRPSQLKGMI